MDQAEEYMQAFWVVYNLDLAIVYGVLHQGGVVPSLIGLHDRLVTLKHNAAPGFNGTLASVTYWKTYMPPWHLLAVSAEGQLLEWCNMLSLVR